MELNIICFFVFTNAAEDSQYNLTLYNIINSQGYTMPNATMEGNK